MNENPTPAPQEQNRSTDPAVPTSRRELRADAAGSVPRPAPEEAAPQPGQPPVTPADPAQQPVHETPVAPADPAPRSVQPPAAPQPPVAQSPAAPADPAQPPVHEPLVAQPPVAPADPAQPPVAQPPAPGAAEREPLGAPTGPGGISQPDFGPASPPLAAPAALDDGTFRGIREPARRGLALDGTWHQISTKYVVSQLVQGVFWIVVLLIAAAVITYATGEPWAWIPAGVISLIVIVNLVILPRQAKALGYMLRGDDVVFRKGILWQRMVAVPYGRMQLIDITHGPLDRLFGVSKLKMVTAAASTGVEIPGLTTAAAEALRDTLIEVAETRRTGL